MGKARMVTCKRCWYTMEWVGQDECERCHARLSNWSVASQLREPRDGRPITGRDTGDEDDHIRKG